MAATSRSISEQAGGGACHTMTVFDSDRDRARVLIVALGLVIAFAVFPLAAGLLGALVLYVAATPAHRWLSGRTSDRVAAATIVAATTPPVFLPAPVLPSLLAFR